MEFGGPGMVKTGDMRHQRAENSMERALDLQGFLLVFGWILISTNFRKLPVHRRELLEISRSENS